MYSVLSPFKWLSIVIKNVELRIQLKDIKGISSKLKVECISFKLIEEERIKTITHLAKILPALNIYFIMINVYEI